MKPSDMNQLRTIVRSLTDFDLRRLMQVAQKENDARQLARTAAHANAAWKELTR